MSTPEFYANARAYDIAFGDRDYADECRFLEWCWRAHGATTERLLSRAGLWARPARPAVRPPGLAGSGARFVGGHAHLRR